jgi:hypothetical protein
VFRRVCDTVGSALIPVVHGGTAVEGEHLDVFDRTCHNRSISHVIHNFRSVPQCSVSPSEDIRYRAVASRLSVGSSYTQCLFSFRKAAMTLRMVIR